MTWFALITNHAHCEESSLAYNLPESLGLPKARHLSAASVPSRLRSRAQQSIFCHETVFEYIHEPENGHEDLVFTATLVVKSLSPILVLEELESDLENILCSDSQISLVFDSIENVNAIRKVVGTSSGFVVVTSHNGCNSEGERATHQVHNVNFDTTGRAVHMKKTSCEWREAFHSMQVSFSRGRPGVQKREQAFGKRQQDTSSTTSREITGSGPTPTISFPSVPLGATVQPSAVIKEINKSFIDKDIFPPQFPGADQIFPQGVTISCKKCTLRGNIEITQSSFNLSGSDDISDIINNTISFFEHGSVEVVSTGLFAHVELGVDISLTQNLPLLPMNLPAIPLSPFEIPGVVVFGPLIQPELEASINLAEAMEFSYGFDLSVPDNSRLKITIPELSNSTSSGFNETKLNTLPLKSTSALVSLITSVTFKPQILLGVKTAAGAVSGGIGGILELPTLSVNITQLSGVDEKCEKPSNAAEEGLDSVLDNVFGNLTNIVPTIDLVVGALADFGVDVANFQEGVATQTVLHSTNYALPTACLAFDRDSQSYGTPVKATTTTASRTGTGAAAAASTSSKEGGDKDGRWSAPEMETVYAGTQNFDIYPRT
ncbi:hypothetical protein VTN00DRAFT_5527 [Thermoascus crustaceus]|uniref:uncharacterized protein n=1 Tax=Thermoascus crustaceus TaxID=5088 RepID=UPI003744B234